MGVDNFFGGHQAQPGAVLLGREKGSEEFFAHLVVHADAGIADGQYAEFSFGAQADFDRSAFRHCLHRVL